MLGRVILYFGTVIMGGLLLLERPLPMAIAPAVVDIEVSGPSAWSPSREEGGNISVAERRQ
jgi:hypothetical protein